ncbi:MAG: PKD domain-containing protein [Candidatus Jorgensenbacteria bacterium]
MGFSKKFFIALVVLGVLGGVFYFVLDKPKELGAKGNPLLNLFLGDPEDASDGGIISDAKEFISDKTSALKESISGSVKESIEEKEGELVNYLKEGANEAIDTAQEKIVGVGKSGSGGSITVLPVVKAGASAYFLISNPESSGEVKYEVDWGDGSAENGVLATKNKTVSHSWDNAGEFSVIFKISGADSVSKSIKVIVTE